MTTAATAAATSAMASMDLNNSKDGPSYSGNKEQDIRSSWMKHSPKAVQLLDKFQMDLRLGRLSHSSKNPDRRILTVKTVELVRQLIHLVRWNTPAQLMAFLKQIGQELHKAGGFREPAIGNVVRRILAAVREEVLNSASTTSAAVNNNSNSKATTSAESTGRRTLESMLWALPQHVKQPQSSSSGSGHRGRTASHEFGSSHHDPPRHVRSESGLSSTDSFEHHNHHSNLLPPAFSEPKPELKQSVMEAILEIMSDLEDTRANISNQATQHIHAGEIILTYGESSTVKEVSIKRSRSVIDICCCD